MTLDKEQKEELRYAALAALAIRAPSALNQRQLFNAVKKEVPFLFEPADLVAACELLRGFTPHPLVDCITADLGTTQCWRATTAGVLHVERS